MGGVKGAKIRPWTYNEVKHVLDIIGQRHFVSDQVYADVSAGFTRTVAGVRATHYLWNCYLGKGKGKGLTRPSNHLKAIFDAYRSANIETYPEIAKATSETVATVVIPEAAWKDTSEVSNVLEKELYIVEQSFEALKASIENLVIKAVDAGVAQERKQMKAEQAEMEKELKDLREFKENVKDSSVFMQLRKAFGGKVS